MFYKCVILFMCLDIFTNAFSNQMLIYCTQSVFEYAKTKSQQRFNAFVFTTWIIQSLYFLYPEFQASVGTAWFVSDLVGNSENSFVFVTWLI